MALRGFKKLRFPYEEFYLLQVDGDRLVDVGRFRAEHFVPYEPEKNALMVQYPGERPVILRVVKLLEDNRFVSRDGTGQEFEYRMVEVPDVA